MKFRLPATLLFTAGIALCAHAQLPRIVVQGSGAPQVFTDFEAAVAAAQSNDVLYLSGGTFPYTGGLVIDKTLHFIGAGIVPDSSQATGVTTLHATITNSPLYILTSASGSTFTGVRFTSDWDNSSNTYSVVFGTSEDNDAPTDVVFQRCWFQRHLRLGFPPFSLAVTNTIIDECLFMGNMLGEGGTATVTRSVINQGIRSFFGGALVLENSMVMQGVTNCYSAIIRNCYLYSSGTGYVTYGCDNSIIEHNVTPNQWITSGSPGAVLVNNLENVDGSTFFVSETNNYYEVTDDVHLAPGSPGIGHGTDGTDVGIYGTASPYKPGGVPFNPHFRQADIAPSTNNNGALPVNIRVAAQGH